MTTAELSLQTTGIGSLPHHNVDAALICAFQTTLPFLPQIPIRNPWEYMIPQALEGLPGLLVDQDGAVTLDYPVWKGRARQLEQRLEESFTSEPKNKTAFSAFEPTAATCSAWQPFLWELSEQGIRQAKIQLAGPLTCQWALRLSDGTPADRHPELGSQIYRLIMARAIAMCRRMKSEGIEPVLFLDEPAFFAFSSLKPRHVLALQELRLLIQTLKKEGAQIGVHCCSDTEWNQILALDLDFLSLDTGLSLTRLLSETLALSAYLKRGGRLALGLRFPEPSWQMWVAKIQDEWKGEKELAARMIARAILTPSCGLALQPVEKAEQIFADLKELRNQISIKEWQT